MKRAIVTGAGGFIGWHLCNYLAHEKGYWVRGVDKKMPEFASFRGYEFFLCDLRKPDEARDALRGAEGCEVYHLAADMGGIGFISANNLTCALNNSMIDNAVLSAILEYGCKVFTYTSSACVYRQDLQVDEQMTPKLVESDAWPANPEPGYGLQKLYTEELLNYCHGDAGLEIRIARPHNVYGPYGTWTGGREKAPAALCRKFAEAKKTGGDVEVWGDGKARRSFVYVDDFVRGLHLLAQHDGPITVNLGHEDDVSISGLATMISNIAGSKAKVKYMPSGDDRPQGVRARSCDGALAREALNWEPRVGLVEGLTETYKWIDGVIDGD